MESQHVPLTRRQRTIDRALIVVAVVAIALFFFWVGTHASLAEIEQMTRISYLPGK
jgi:hypothetical protein